MRNKNLTAITLRAVNYGDNDKILTLFSLEEGIISVRAKGVKKARAKLKFASEPFCYGCFEIAASTNTTNNILTGCETKELFYFLREDIVKFYGGSSFLELCTDFLQPQEINVELFKILITSLSLLETSLPPQNVALYFYINALKACGFDIDLTTINMAVAKILAKFITLEISEIEQLDITIEQAKLALKNILEHINRTTSKKNKSLTEFIGIL